MKIKDKIAILVVSFDNYKDLWIPFYKCFFRYWPNCEYKLFHGNNFENLEIEKVSQIKIGEDKGYSSNLIKMLSKIDYEYVILWIDDFFLKEKIDQTYLNNAMKYVVDNKIGYLKLISTYPLAYKNNGTIGQIPNGIKYTIGIGNALWNKKTLLNYLHEGESAWDIEYKGPKRSLKFNDTFYSLNSKELKKPLMKIVNILGRGKLLHNAIDFLKKENIYDLFETREKVNLTTYIYYLLFHKFLRILTFFRIYY